MTIRPGLRRYRGSVLALTTALAVGAAACLGTSAAAAAATTRDAATTAAAAGPCWSKAHPKLAAEISRGIVSALSGRVSVVGITAVAPAEGITCRYHPWWNFHSASVVKVIILGTLLRELQARHQTISPGQAALARAMITQSDNNAATALWNDVGVPAVQRFLTAAEMDHTVVDPDGFWGLTEVNANDELLLLRLLVTRNKVLDNSSRSYVLRLMSEVILSQRWGAPAGAPANVVVHVKNGWLPDPSFWVVNSIADFTHRGSAYSIAILTKDNPSMAYGVDTVQRVAVQINQDLAMYVRWAAKHPRAA
jgi:hypothetical protein